MVNTFAGLAAVVVCALASGALAADALPFSAQKPGIPVAEHYRLIGIPKIAQNAFSLVEDEGRTVLKVDSHSSASTVGLPLTATRETGTALQWRWKVSRTLDAANPRIKSGDDFAARVYVFFDVPLDSLSFADRAKNWLARVMTGMDVPTAAICYVWDHREAMGASFWSPYTQRVRMVVLRNESSGANAWHSERRDLAADFKSAFGIDLGTSMPRATGVAVGSDTDNTAGRVTTWFGDVAFAP
jgi:Protein of unknown function (DUF3047)